MAVNDNSFFQYNETRAQSGYKSAWLVKRPSEQFYSLVGATESVPYVFGDKEAFDFDLLQSPTKGQVQGKMSLEAQDIEVLHHRDNAYRYEKLKELGTLDFMVINSEFVGYKFVGTLEYRPNNADAEVNRATVTITPMSAQATPIFNARPQVQETLCFENSIPESVKVGTAIDFSVTQSNTTPTFTVKKIADGTNAETYAAITTDYTISETKSTELTFASTGLYAITVSDSKYASWTTTVYVESAT